MTVAGLIGFVSGAVVARWVYRMLQRRRARRRLEMIRDDDQWRKSRGC